MINKIRLDTYTKPFFLTCLQTTIDEINIYKNAKDIYHTCTVFQVIYHAIMQKCVIKRFTFIY